MGISYMHMYQFCRHMNIFHNEALLKTYEGKQAN